MQQNGEIPVTTSEEVFGQIVCPEDPDIYVDEKEMDAMGAGFDNYKQLFSPPDLSDEQREYLLNPDVLSVTVGFQAMKSMSMEAMSSWVNSMERAGLDYTQDYGVMFTSSFYNRETGETVDYDPSWEIINLRQTEFIFSENPEIFDTPEDADLSDPTTIIEHYTKMRATEDDELFHIRIGLLSGYPLSDCLRWNEDPAHVRRPVVFQVAPAEQATLEKLSEFAHMYIDELPTSSEDDTFRPGLQLHPDERDAVFKDSRLTHIESYGIGWATIREPDGSIPEDTLRYCQQLLKIDRELGIKDFMDDQRSRLDLTA